MAGRFRDVMLGETPPNDPNEKKVARVQPVPTGPMNQQKGGAPPNAAQTQKGVGQIEQGGPVQVEQAEVVQRTRINPDGRNPYHTPAHASSSTTAPSTPQAPQTAPVGGQMGARVAQTATPIAKPVATGGSEGVKVVAEEKKTGNNVVKVADGGAAKTNEEQKSSATPETATTTDKRARKKKKEQFSIDLKKENEAWDKKVKEAEAKEQQGNDVLANEILSKHPPLSSEVRNEDKSEIRAPHKVTIYKVDKKGNFIKDKKGEKKVLETVELPAEEYKEINHELLYDKKKEEEKRLAEEEEKRLAEEEARKIPHIEKYDEELALEDYLEQVKLLAPEEKEKALKKAKRKALFSAIGDGMNALSNIVGTHYGSTYIPQTSMTDKQRERWNKRQEKWKANEEKYYNIKQELAKLRDKRLIQNINIDMMNRKNKQDDELAKWQIALAENKAISEKWQAVQAQYKAAIAEMEAAATPEQLELATKKLQSAIDASDALAAERKSATALNNAKKATEGTKQTYYKSAANNQTAQANKNNQQANYYGAKAVQVGNQTYFKVRSGDTEFSFPKGAVDNNYGTLYNAIVRDFGEKVPALKKVTTAAQKKDIVMTYWSSSPSCQAEMAGLANKVNGGKVEKFK